MLTRPIFVFNAHQDGNNLHAYRNVDVGLVVNIAPEEMIGVECTWAGWRSNILLVQSVAAGAKTHRLVLSAPSFFFYPQSKTLLTPLSFR